MSVRILAATEAAIAEAAGRLQRGELVVFPTETVYGLGANALDAEAVARIFAAKGRPTSNPVIVHVATLAQARALTTDWNARADDYATRFCPGPLTLVVQKIPAIPNIVTAGGETVGIRLPAHPVAQALLLTAGVPVAAPSANRSEEVSPTTAQHVADSLGAFVDDLLILDGGACTVGIESTVVDVTAEPPRLLRPGHITAAELGIAETLQTDTLARSPGQRARHYAPKKPTRLVTTGTPLLPGEALLPCDTSPVAYATALYARLRALDADTSVLGIAIELPPSTPEWEAIHDRLRRAAVQVAT
jgi:L-threonylcarbamoyladenylate synthase